MKASYTRPTHFQRFTKAVVTQCNQHILVHRSTDIKVTVPAVTCDQDDTSKKLLTLSKIDDLYPQDTWIRIYTDGSATDAIQDGGAGSIIYLHCTNYAAEVKALSQGAQAILDIVGNHKEDVMFLTDSKSVLDALACHGEHELRVKLSKLIESRRVLKNVYIGTIRPHLDYGSTTCSSASKTSNYTLEKVQNQALRLITGSMQTTPIKIMEEITANQPLSKRKDMRIMMQAERYKCSPSHPMKTKIHGMTKKRIKRESFIHKY